MSEKELSKTELDELKKQARELLAMARQKLLVKHTFVGSVAMKLDLIPVRDKFCRTAETDGSRIFFDIGFLNKLTPDEQVFVLSHEVWHCVMMHMLRLQNREIRLFNIATDLEVNNLLIDDGMIAPENILKPIPEHKGKSAEEIYEYLLKKMKKDMKSNASKQSSGNGKGNGHSSSGYGSSSDDNYKKSDLDGSKDGNKTGELSGQFDKHSYGDEEKEDGDGDGDITDQWGKVGRDPDYTPHMTSNLGEELREKVISAAQQTERTKGSLPANITRIIERLEKPEIKWQDVLAQFVTSSLRSGDHYWNPPSRRHVWHDMYLPSQKEDRIKVTVAIDTSGSTSGDLPKFFSELKSLLNTFGKYTINVIQCDCQVDSVETFDSEDNPFDYDEKNFKFSGGGGSSTIPVFDKIYDDGIEQDCLIYMTDGFIDAPQFPPQYPVLWILTGDGDESFCDWGKKVKFKNDGKRW